MAQGAAGTINMANLQGFTTIEYFTAAAGSVNIINPVAGLTVNVFDETTAAQNVTIGGPVPPAAAPTTGPAGLNDALTVDVGNPNHAPAGGDALGDITAFGYELFTLNAFGGKGLAGATVDDIGGIVLVPTLGGNEQVTIGGDTTLQMAMTHIFGAIQDQTTSGGFSI